MINNDNNGLKFPRGGDRISLGRMLSKLTSLLQYDPILPTLAVKIWPNLMCNLIND